MDGIVNISAGELEKTRDTMVDIYEALSQQQVLLAKRISALNYYLEAPLSHRTGIKGFSKATVQKSGVIKVTVNRTPEKVKLYNRVGTQYYKEMKDFWEGSIINALSEIGIQRIEEKVYIIIEICHHPGDEWDIDNHNVKFIIDAIRYAGIIKNDTYKNVSYYVCGKNTEDEMTNIYITKQENFLNLLNYLL